MFDPNEFNGSVQDIIFFSVAGFEEFTSDNNDGSPDAADSGLAGSGLNVVTIKEGTLYTPQLGQPGSNPLATVQPTYFFNSGVEAPAPEPSSLWLVGVGILGTVRLVRRRIAG